MAEKETELTVLKEIRDFLKARFPHEPVLKPEATLNPHFIDNKNGTISDAKTGLIWVKNPHTDLPKKFKGTMKWQDAIDACKELDFAGYKDWRLPTVEELRSIVDYSCGVEDNEPAIERGVR